MRASMIGAEFGAASAIRIQAEGPGATRRTGAVMAGMTSSRAPGLCCVLMILGSSLALPAAAQSPASTASTASMEKPAAPGSGSAAPVSDGAVPASAAAHATLPTAPAQTAAAAAPPTSPPPAAAPAVLARPAQGDPKGLAAQGGSLAPQPAIPAAEIAGLPLARLLETDARFSGLGSFKQLLPKYGITTYIHGLVLAGIAGRTTPEPDEIDDGVSGNNGPYFGAEINLFLGAELRDRVFAEAQFFYDSSGNTVGFDYGQVDIRIYRDYLFVRGGRFRTPLGGMNPYPDARYLFKLPNLPLFVGEVIPYEWEEVGAQLYGRYSWAEGRAVSYTAYVVNGLEQKVTNPGDPISGGSIRLMNDNWLDKNDPDKGVGAQLLIEPIPGFTLGASGYEGVYTITGKHRLYIADGQVGLARGNLTLRGEFAATFQETETDPLLKIGGYGLVSYRILRYIEPVVMFDGYRLDGARDLDRLSASVGLIVYPYPQKVPSAAVRLAYTASWKDSGDFATNRLALQAAVAF